MQQHVVVCWGRGVLVFVQHHHRPWCAADEESAGAGVVASRSEVAGGVSADAGSREKHGILLILSNDSEVTGEVPPIRVNVGSLTDFGKKGTAVRCIGK